MADDSVWVDRHSAPTPEPVVFEQVGWLLELTPEHVVLTSSVSDKIIAARDRIPAGMVRSIHEYDPDGGSLVAVPKKRRKKTA